VFKYVSYEKVETEHTVLEFRGGDDIIKVKHYDVPVVSIEADIEADIDSLIAQQPAEIKCTELVRADFIAITKDTAQTKRALVQINDVFESSVNALSDGVPDNERLSWDKQEAEARAFVAASTAATPLIDNLALARGIDKAYLVSKIIEKADLSSVAVGTLVGERQKKEDELLA